MGTRDSVPSNGSKAVQCVKCLGPIPAYAGERVTAYPERYAHHAGQCVNREAREARTRAAVQDTLFAWTCNHVQASRHANAEPVTCDVVGTDRAEYAEHMAGHGIKPWIDAPKRMIKLTRKVPRASLPKILLERPFKWATWERVTIVHACSECGHAGTSHQTVHGHDADYEPVTRYECHNGRCPCTGWQSSEPIRTPMRGQYWCNGYPAHSVIVITHTPYGSEVKPEFVVLYSHGDGQWSEDSYTARRAREACKRASERLAA